MIASKPGREPKKFEERCRQRGKAWLRTHPNAKRPRDYWSEFRSELADAAKDLCAYCAMYEPVGTVDHFEAVSNDLSLAYEWSNYRFVTANLNSKKGKHGPFLDPFEVEDGWFEIILPSLQLRVTDKIPAKLRPLAERTIQKLGLRDHETIIRQRRAWMSEYERGAANLSLLDRKAPLLAAAIRRENTQAQSNVAKPSGQQVRRKRKGKKGGG